MVDRRFPFPIYLKIALAMFGLVVAVVAGMSWITLERTMRQHREHMTEASALAARLIANYSLEPVVMGNYSSLRSVLTEVLDSNQDVIVIEVLDEKGIPRVNASRPRSRHQQVGVLVHESSGMQGKPVPATYGTGDHPQAEAGDTATWPEVTSPIVAYGRTWGYVRLSYSLSGFKRAVAAARFQILGVAGISALLSLLMAGILSRAIVTPVRKLVSHARAISTGDLDTPIEVASRDEIGFLATTLEGMRLGLRQFVSHVARRAIGFEGDLDLFGLPAVLALVRTGMRTGGLVLERGSTAGVIYFKNGEIVDAALGDCNGEDALYAFFAWTEGTFKFSPRLVPGRITIEADWARLILEGTRRVSDKAAFEQVIHSQDFVPSRRRLAEGITSPADAVILRDGLLEPEEARVLALVDGRRSVRDIAGVFGQGPADPATVYPLLYRLIAVGLVGGDDEASMSGDEAAGTVLEARSRKPGNVIVFPGKRVQDSRGG